MIKLINYFFQSLIIYLIFLVGRLLGIKLSRIIFSKIFCLIGPFFKSKKIIKKNIKIFYENGNSFNEKNLINDMWKNYGMTFIEYIFLHKFKKGTNYVQIKGEENLLSLDKNKPAIFISGHLANFELMAMEITKKNIELAAIYRPLNNFFLNPFMEYLRKKYICKNQIKKGINGVRDAIGFVKKGHSIALMIDQRVSEGEKIKFFGKDALTTTLPAQLSIKYDLKIIPVYIERNENKNFTIEFQNAINPRDFQKNKEILTLNLNQKMERMIVKNPSQWIWTHNRWK